MMLLRAKTLQQHQIVSTTPLTLTSCLQPAEEVLRAMVLADSHARPVVDILCRSLDPSRGDKFLIVQVGHADTSDSLTDTAGPGILKLFRSYRMMILLVT